MTFLVAVTAAFALLHPLSLANAVSDPLPVVRAEAAPGPRYVRLRLELTAYGVKGRGEIVVDRANGRFLRRFDAGPVSEREGWDGVRPWRADATGMARVQGNADQRAAILGWARMLGTPEAGPGERPVHPPEATAEADGATLVVQHVGGSLERVILGAPRSANGVLAPRTISDTSDSGTWSARVIGIETPRSVRDETFAPPRDPGDVTFDGVDRVPLLGESAVPVVAVRINDGPPLRFIVDTGGQNVITPAAARRAGLEVVGAGTVGGAGPALATIRYATVRSMRIDRVELRNQPFIVLAFGAAQIDGIVGYELLARFAARLDMAHRRLDLARDADSLVAAGTAVPMAFDERQPQVEGAIDGLRGALTLDTGSSSAVDVNAPFVRAHDLRARYHADVGGFPISGVGGPVHAYFAHAAQVRIGDVPIPDVDLLLTDAANGFEADPTVAANVGMKVLQRFSLVFDYRRAVVAFES